MNRSITAILLLMALLSSCSKETVNPDAPTGDGVIRINSVIEDAVQSRGVAAGNMALEDMRFLHGTTNSSTGYGSSFAGKTPFSGSRAENGKITFDVPQMYRNKEVIYSYIAAWWPAGTFDETARSVRWEIDGKTDILMTPQPYNAGNYLNPSTASMKLSHALAQLEVICVADNAFPEAVVQASWGKITKIEILESERVASSTLAEFANGECYFTSPGNIALWQKDYNTPFPDAGVTLLRTPNPAVTAAGMFAPVQMPVDDDGTTPPPPIQLKVYTEKFPLGVEVTVQLQLGNHLKWLMKGQCHKVTLTFGAADQPIKVLSTGIEAWKTGYTANDTPMESPEPVIISYGVAPYDIVSGYFDRDLITLTGSTSLSYNSYAYNSSNANYNGGYVPYDSSDKSAAVNKQPPYWKFEIAKENSATEPTWQAAWDVCKAKAPAGEWRLPRLSELVLMYLNRTALGLKDFDDLLYIFWSGTEMEANKSYFVSPCENYYGNSAKTNDTEMFARCVREIPQARIILELGKTPYDITSGTFNTSDAISITTTTSVSYNGYTYNADNADNNGGYKATLATAVADQPPYKKLEIALEDEPGTGAFITHWNACKNKTTDRGGWRMPRVSELILMSLNRTNLEKVVGFTPFKEGAIYWSGTESATNYAFLTIMGKDQVKPGATSIAGGRVRCVREVP